MASYQYTVHIWPSLVTALVVAALAAYAWRQRQVPGARPFAIGCLLAVLWAIATALEAAAAQDATRVIWTRVAASLQLPSITAVACFLLEYVWPGRWLSRRNILLLSIVPALLVLLVLTEPHYHLLWSGFRFDGGVTPLRTPLMWAFVGYGYLIGLGELVALTWLFVRSPRQRWPVAIMLAGFVGARAIYLIDARLDVYTITISMLTYSVALFGFRILDARTLAFEAAIAGMDDGLLVLDRSGRVASLNPAAERLLALSATGALLQPMQALVTRSPALASVLAAAEGAIDELHLGQGADVRTLRVNAVRLHDFRGLDSGRVVTLQDVTALRGEQRRAAEQERALAMLREREQLAGELHDSLGQVLGYAGLQTDLAAKLIGQGQAREAHALLLRLASVLREAHGDLRQQIMDLRAAPTAHGPLEASIRRYLQSYGDNYGIATELTLDAEPPDSPLPAEAQAQLYRILQEALSNVRKHSGARRVAVGLARSDGTLELTIADDGRGFDPGAPADGSHLGLRNMRQRAEQLGGALEIETGPAGTTVRVRVPIAEEPDARTAG